MRVFNILDIILNYINFVEQLYVYFYFPSFAVIFWVFFAINLVSSMFSPCHSFMRSGTLTALELAQLMLYLLLVPTSNRTLTFILVVTSFTFSEIIIVFVQHCLEDDEHDSTVKRREVVFGCCVTSALIALPALTIYMRSSSNFKVSWFEIVLSVSLFYTTLGATIIAKALPKNFQEFLDEDDEGGGGGGGGGGGEDKVGFTFWYAMCLGLIISISSMVLLVSEVVVGFTEVINQEQHVELLASKGDFNSSVNFTVSAIAENVGIPMYDFVVAFVVLFGAAISICSICVCVCLTIRLSKSDNQENKYTS